MMYRKARASLTAVLFLASALFLLSQRSLHAQNSVTAVQPRSAVSILDSTKDQDGLVGSVRRVKTESAKIEAQDGRAVEGPRQLLELTTYGIKGNRIENVSYPIPDSLVGKEEYKYDNRGNIVEMTLRDDLGQIINREAYSYEFDSFGNWTKMITSLVVFENGELKREPVEVTYRTLTYYFDDTIAKIVAPSPAASTAAEFQPTAFAGGKVDDTTFQSEVASNSFIPAETPASSTVDEPKPARLIAVLKPGTRGGASGSPDTSAVRDAASSDTANASERSSSRLKAKINGAAATPNEATTEDSSPLNSTLSSSSSAEDTLRLKTANEYFQTGLARFERGDLKEAVDAYLESIKLEPKSAEVYLNLGLSYLKLEKDKEAAKAFSDSVKLNPQSAEAQYGLGLASFRLHRFREAANSFKKAVTLKPEMAKAHYGLGLSYQELNEQNGLVEELRILERLDKELAKKLVRTFPQVSLPCRYNVLCQ
jgi:Flp pilus assembly protein TadD